MLLVYFAIGMSGRLLSIVFFFTPILGLFDTNYHGVLGSFDTSNRRENNNNYKGVVFGLLDYTNTNKPIFF
jgi:hypothetical protein